MKMYLVSILSVFLSIGCGNPPVARNFSDVSGVASKDGSNQKNGSFLLESEKELIASTTYKGMPVVHFDNFFVNSKSPAVIRQTFDLGKFRYYLLERNGVLAIALPHSLFMSLSSLTGLSLADQCNQDCGASAIAGGMLGALGGGSDGASIGALGGPGGAIGGAVIGGFVGGLGGGIAAWEACKIATQCKLKESPGSSTK